MSTSKVLDTSLTHTEFLTQLLTDMVNQGEDFIKQASVNIPECLESLERKHLKTSIGTVSKAWLNRRCVERCVEITEEQEKKKEN